MLVSDLGGVYRLVLQAMAAVGKAIGFEGRAKHNDYAKNNKGQSKDLFGLTFFAPNINIVRDVRWGRSQETFGEDPFLTATLAVPLIRGMQSNASYGSSYPLVSATAKHFFACKDRDCALHPEPASPIPSW